MAVPFLGLATAGISALQANKQNQVAQGTKTFTKPRTAFGKLFGNISGRSQAFEAQEMNKQNLVNPNIFQSMQRQTTPISGGFEFGGQARRGNYLPFAVLAAIVAIFYSMRNKKGGRRR